MEGLKWRETRPGRWERPQSHLEKINILSRNVPKAIGRDNWAKHAVAKIQFDSSVKDPAYELRTAWKQVRYNHPEVAAFPYNGNYVYRVGDGPGIALWVSATFSVAINITVDELLGRIPRNEQMMCYYLPYTSEVMVWSPHYRVDARGAIFCLNRLITSLANLNPDIVFGGCAVNLTPSLESTLELHDRSTPDVERAVKKRLEALEPHHPALELTPKITAQKPGITKRHFIRLAREDASALLKSCTDSSLAIDVVLHSALIDAVAKIVAPKDARSFMASFHSNLRSLIPEGVPKQSPTSYTSVITTEVNVSPLTDFASYYAQLAPVYKAGYKPYLKSSNLFHKRLAEQQFGTAGSTPPKGETDGQLQPRFAFLGVIDDQIARNVSNGRIQIKDFWLGAETLTMRMMVHTWIFDGQLVLSVTYNESYWDKAAASDLLNRMRDALLEVSLRGSVGCMTQ